MDIFWTGLSIASVVMWLICGIICLYHMNFEDDLHNGLTGVFAMIGMALLVLSIGPFLLPLIPRNKDNTP